MPHLLSECSFSRQVWHEVLGWCRLPVTIPSADVPFLDWLASSIAGSPRGLRRGLSSLVLLTAWWIWKQRNACVFDNDRASVSHLSSTIKDEARSWARAGAHGIRAILPET